MSLSRRDRDIKYYVVEESREAGASEAAAPQPRFLNRGWEGEEGYGAALSLAMPCFSRDIFQCPESWLAYAKGVARLYPGRMLFELLASLDTESFGPKVCSEVLYLLHTQSECRFWHRLGDIGEEDWR